LRDSTISRGHAGYKFNPSWHTALTARPTVAGTAHRWQTDEAIHPTLWNDQRQKDWRRVGAGILRRRDSAVRLPVTGTGVAAVQLTVVLRSSQQPPNPRNYIGAPVSECFLPETWPASLAGFLFPVWRRHDPARLSTAIPLNFKIASDSNDAIQEFESGRFQYRAHDR
jgi:hypothetical protein